jgi:multicomponent Na+:H+ antiporter subunit B
VNSVILITTSRLLRPLLLAFSLFVLMRGHNEPGGGFAGGLLAASAFTLQALCLGVASARRALRIEPHTLMGAGLLLAAGSGIPTLAEGEPFLTGRWTGIAAPFDGEIAVSTTLLFDIGVYLVVLGVTLLIVFTLIEEET